MMYNQANSPPDGQWYLTAQIQPRRAVLYKLQYTFGLGPEIIKRTVNIKVI